MRFFRTHEAEQLHAMRMQFEAFRNARAAVGDRVLTYAGPGIVIDWGLQQRIGRADSNCCVELDEAEVGQGIVGPGPLHSGCVLISLSSKVGPGESIMEILNRP